MIQPKTLSDINNDPATAKTQLVIVTGLLVLSWVFSSVYLVYAAGIAGLLSFISPVGTRIVWLWYKVAEVLGWLNSRVLLSLVYYLFVTPIAFLFRLFGNDPMRLKDNKGSMFEPKEHTYTKGDLENPW